MNKPLTMIINETKEKIIKACNESGLPIVMIDLIVQGIYSEIHLLAEKQIREDERVFAETVKEDEKENKENEKEKHE
jgi:hypothetical protein